MSRGNIFGALLSLAILGLAGWLYYYGGDRPPDEPESGTWWYCHACKRGFGLSAREYEGQIGFDVPKGPDGKPDRLGRQVAVVRCRTCVGIAVAARKCLTDGTIFDPRPSQQSSGACPQCGWRPLANPGP